MKYFVIFLFAIVLLPGNGIMAQSRKTIILVRHAEKADATSSDPELSAAGRERALRLVKVIGKYKPGAVYSTNFKRTRDTATPIAKKRGVEVKIFDPKNSAELIEEIMKSKTKRFVIAGHSNTTPALANLLLKKDLLKSFDDSDYGNILVVRFKDGNLIKAEILQY